MKNKLLKSSIFVICSGIVFYIISLSFFSAINEIEPTIPEGTYHNPMSPFYYSVPFSEIQNLYFPGFIFFVIALVFMLIGGILLLIGYFKDRVDKRKVLITTIVVIFFSIGFSFVTLAKFLKFNGYIPGSLDTSLSPHVYIISQIILEYYYMGYNIWPVSLGLIIIGIILLLFALFSKKKAEKNEIKEKNWRKIFLISSLSVLCAGIAFYIISLIFIIEFIIDYNYEFTSQFWVSTIIIHNEYFLGFISFIIGLVLEVIGGIILLIGYLIRHLGKRKVFVASIVVIFSSIGFSFISLIFFRIINVDYFYKLTSINFVFTSAIQNEFISGFVFSIISLVIGVIGINLLLNRYFIGLLGKRKIKEESNKIKEKNSKNKLLKSSIFVFCSGIFLYIIAFSFTINPWTGYTLKNIFRLMMEELFPGFITFIIASVLEIIGVTLLFIRCSIGRVGKRKV